MSCMEWLWIDVDGNWEWCTPDQWRIRDLDQQCAYRRGAMRHEAEQARKVSTPTMPVSAPKQSRQRTFQVMR